MAILEVLAPILLVVAVIAVVVVLAGGPSAQDPWQH